MYDGSDVALGMYQRLFDRLGLPEESMEGIRWKTAADVFRIEVS